MRAGVTEGDCRWAGENSERAGVNGEEKDLGVPIPRGELDVHDFSQKRTILRYGG